jgi:atypical dual specificity phosphatase
VHCKAGHGRSAAVALCWLVTQNPGVSTQVLNQRMCEKRRVRKVLYQQNSIKSFTKEWMKEHGGKD